MKTILDSLTQLFAALSKLCWAAQVAAIVGLVVVICFALSNPAIAGALVVYAETRHGRRPRK